MPNVKLTDKFLKAAKPSAGNATTRYWDTECTGLFSHVGKRAVTFYAKAGGQNYKIGRWPQWTLYEARERCQEIRRKVDAGEDPAPVRRAVPTVRAAFDDFERVRLAKRRSSTAREYRAQMELHMFPKLGDRPIDRLTRAELVDLHTALSAAGKAVRANRVVATVSSLYGFLQRDRGFTGANPAANIERNPEHGREIFLDPEQVTALRVALEEYAERTGGRSRGNAVVADCLLFIIATGCRSGEAKAATWDQFDAELTVWTKPASTTKQKKMHRVPLGPAAQSVLLRRRALRRDGEVHVFRGRDGRDRITELKTAWATVSKAAGLAGVRIHDLRHTYASLAISSGVPLKVVGGLLGHSAIATTNRYAHLYEDDLKVAADKVDAKIEGGK